MTDAEILSAIADVAREHLGWKGPVRPEMNLIEDLGLDSLRVMTLVGALEDRLHVRFDDEDESEVTTVAALVAAVRRRLDA